MDDKKKLYKVEFDGHYLGGISIVWAENEERAIEITRDEMKAHGLDETHESHGAKKVVPFSKGIVYFWDGDY